MTALPALDEERLRHALQSANFPILLAVLFQLTGNRKWIEAPFLPTRPAGLDDHDDGGFDDLRRAEILDAAVTALRDWAGGRPPAVDNLDGELLVEVMSAGMGEPIPAEYGPMVESSLNPAIGAPGRVGTQTTVVIIGAGVSGMLAAYALRRAGCDVTVLEKNAEVGGTWLENRYPGCGVDTPSHLYEISAFGYPWSSHFARRDEVQQYMLDVAEHFAVRSMIEFETTVTALRFDEANGNWGIDFTGPNGQSGHRTADVVVTAVGTLNRPSIPDLPGSKEFGGIKIHSAQWPEQLELTGRRVAVIGSGASAMQIVPRIAEQVSNLTIYQRSPGWVAPNGNYFRPISEEVQWLLANVPFYRAWFRFRLAWTFYDKVHPALQIDPEWPHPERSVNAYNDVYRKHFLAYLNNELAGRPDLIEMMTPNYPPFGKRILLDNGWFAALKRPNVELVSEPIDRLTAGGIQTRDGIERPADVIIFATGFQAPRALNHIQIEGMSSQVLREVWDGDNPKAYLGMAAPGFPNLFFLYGPNTNLGHGGSFIPIAEAQVHYLADLLIKARAHGPTTVECRQSVHDRYNDDIDAAHARMIWSHNGMNTWYRNQHGRVVANYPGRIVDYWHATRQADLGDYICRPLPTPNTDGNFEFQEDVRT
jgi:4-hydroxyacetophenone monooxygenase